jgi:predicted metal-dependent peptidase
MKSAPTSKQVQKKQEFQLSCSSDPIDPQVQSRVRDKLVTARVALLIKKPFFGNIATRLALTPADEWCPTAATDGRRFYFNHAFVDALNSRELEFLFGHEVLHVVYDHMDRRGDRDHKLFNVACDYCVNQDLVDQKVGELITTVPALYDTKYAGWCAEQVYDDLFNNATKINIDDLVDQLLDEHLSEPGESDQSTDSEGKAGSKARPQLSAEERKQIRDEIREAMINAASQCAAGDLPGGVQRMLKDLTEPKMNWRQLLKMSLDSTVQNDYSWLNVSRRGWDMDAVLPGMIPDEQIDICVAIDMSGSITEAQGRDFLSEIRGIMNQFTQYRVHVWCFDTQVYNPQVFTSDDISDICNYQLAGGGGTSFDANWEWMKENDVNPKRFVMFTDGYTYDGWGDAEYCETVFVIHGNPGCEAPHGITTHYE